MKNLHKKFIGNRLYLLLLLGWLAVSNTSCISYVYYSPSGGAFSGNTSYCTGAAAGADSFTYDQCMGGTAGFLSIETDANVNVQWYYNTTGSTVPASSTPYSTSTFTSAAGGGSGVVTYTPLTTSAGTLYYFADMTWSGTGYCSNEFITPAQAITVATVSLPITGGASSICSGGTTTFADATTGGTWSTDNPAVAIVNSSGLVTTITSGTVNIDYTVGSCTLSSPLTVNLSPPTPVVTPLLDTVCNGSSIRLTATVGRSITNLVPANSFESSFPGTGWTTSGALGGDIFQQTASGSSDPAVAAAEDGSYFLWFDSFDYGPGNGNLISPAFSLTGDSACTITFWVYREYNSLYTTGTGYGTEGMTVEINDVVPAAIGGSTVLGFVPRDRTTATTGSYISGTSLPSSDGWYQYTCVVPASYAGYTSATNNIYLHFHSAYGDNCYLDNVSIQAYATTAPPVWSSSAFLFSNAALTVAYTGGSTDTVYVHPTTVTTDTTITYTASETLGSCSTTDSAKVTIYDPTATIGNDTTICSGGNTIVTFTAAAGDVVSYNINGGTTQLLTIGASGTATVSTGTLLSNTTYNLIGVVSGICSATLTHSEVITVTPSPSGIVGDSSICFGSVSTLSATPTGGSWSSGSASIATIDPASGTFTGIDTGSARITYTAPTTGCLTTTTATIFPLPRVYTMTGTGTVSYCAGSAGLDIGLSSSQSGVRYQLYNGSTATGTAITGTGSAIDFGYQAAAGTYSILATNSITLCTSNMYGTANVIINALPTVYDVTGGGAYCAGSTGIDIGLSGSQNLISYQLYRGATLVGTALSGTTSALDFGIITTAGTYTVLATNTITGCKSDMADSAVVIVHPLPGVYAVTGGGSFCAGGAGYDVALGGSATGISYQLYNGSAAVGSALAGTGSALDFGVLATGGTYTVLATDTTTSCTNAMSGSAVIVVNPLPIAYNVTGGGAYCSGSAGELVGLSNSQSGLSYQLYDGSTATGTAVTGTGSAISFGYQTAAGTYTVFATNTATGCTNDMASSVSISVNPLPLVYNVTGGGSYCAGGAGFDISLSGSSFGTSYQLYNGGTAVGTALAGSGTPLNFGIYTPAGVYTVLATNTGTGCINDMSDNATIIVNPLPTVYNVTGGGSYCIGGSGVVIGLNSSETGINYQLFLGTTPEGTIPGTGSSVSFGAEPVAGTYTVFATNPATGCTNSMSDSATVVINSLVYDSVSVAPGPVDSVCTGSTVTFIATSVGGGTAPSYQWTVNGSVVAGADNTYSYIPSDSDVVNCVMTSSFPCGIPASPSYSVAMTVLNYGYPTVSIASVPVFTVCQGSSITITPTDTNGGYNPVYSWLVNGVIAYTGPVFAYYPTNNDSVSCILSSNYQCRLADSANSNVEVMSVDPLLIPSVTIITSPSIALTAGDTATFHAVVTNGGPDPIYQWFINDTLLPTEVSSTFTTGALANGDSISCVVTNSGTCGGLITYNYAIINEFANGVQQLGNAGSVIYLLPNPNKGIFTVKGNWAITNNEDASVTVTDMLGQVVYKGNIKTEQGKMSEQISLGSSLANGVYLLNLNRGSESKIFHFVVEQ